MNDLTSLLSKLDSISEGNVTPTKLSNGLNKQQKSVSQMPALFKPKKISVLGNNSDPEHPAKGYFVGGESAEPTVATEDVLNKMRRKFGDFLSDVERELKADPEIQDKVKHQISRLDVLGPTVKTIITDDGHEIKIHGNEDDGFRLSVKGRPHSAIFKDLNQAEIACEVFENVRRMRQQPAQVELAPQQNPDYMEEQ